MYRVFIMENYRRYYLIDILIVDGMEHPVFNTEVSRAMPFRTLDAAMAYRKRLIAMKHEPHIESFGRG